MTISSSLMLAFRLIFPRSEKKSSARKSVLGAIVCIGLCIVPLVTVVSVVNGMINGMTERMIALSSNHLNAILKRNASVSASFENLNEYSKRFLQVDGVDAVYPTLECDSIVASFSYRMGSVIRAFNADIFESNPDFKKYFKIVEGNIFDFKNGTRNAVIGENLAKTLGITCGQTFSLITARTLSSGSVVPKMTVFKVAAIVSSGYQELDSLWVFIPLDVAYSVIPLEKTVKSVQIHTLEPFSTNLIAIQNECSKKAGNFARVFNWMKLNESRLQTFSSTRLLIMLIMILISLVAVVNIASALVMLVMERRNEIAILKSVGGSSKGITFAFLVTGVCCGVAGTLIGMPIGILCSLNANKIILFMEKVINFGAKIFYILKGKRIKSFYSIKLMDPAYYLSEIPVDIPFNQLALISVSVILLSLLVSIIPAIKAGKEKPLDIFRKA